MRRALLIAVSLMLLAPAGTARAQRGIDTQTLRPALDGFGLFVTERAETSKQWDFGFKLFLDYAHAPLKLALKDAGGGVQTGAGSTLMDYLVTTRLGAHLGFTDWLELAIEVPVSAQRFADLYGLPLRDNDAGTNAKPTGFYAAQPPTNIAPPTGGPQDPRLALKLRTPRLGPVGLALVLAATVPFGDESAFLGDADFTFRPTAVFDLTVGRFTLALNGGAIVRKQTTVYDPADVAMQRAMPNVMLPPPAVLLSVGTEVTAGLGVGVRLVKWLGLAAEAYALIPVTAGPDGAAKDYVLGALGGFQLFPGRDVTLSVGGGASVLPSHRGDTFRVFAGLAWTPSGRGAQAGRGGDRDGDGLADGSDLCPGEPEDKDGFQDADGCPDPDNDGDGVLDAADRCPAEIEDRDGVSDEDGCPEADNDGDGVPDEADRCPGEAEDVDGFDDEDGCPEADNDLDAVPDARDRCPNEAEIRNGVDDEDGCPDSAASLTPSSSPSIDKAAPAPEPAPAKRRRRR